MKQKDAFLEGEGDAWFDRNHDKLGMYDPVTPLIDELGIKPTNVLEVGCANGWRLSLLRHRFGCQVWGVEPSMKAIMDGTRFRVPMWQMTASTLPVTLKPYDMIIYGFCLYLTDPDDWLTIAAEADRHLADGGHIIIHDFGDWVGGKPIARRYEHKTGVTSHHYAFANLWLGNPRYQIVKAVDGRQSDMVTVLRKNTLAETFRTEK